VEYRIHNKQLEIRMFRDNRSTAAYRRHEGIKVVVKRPGKSQR
jgi:hypothetical protein